MYNKDVALAYAGLIVCITFIVLTCGMVVADNLSGVTIEEYEAANLACGNAGIGIVYSDGDVECSNGMFISRKHFEKIEELR